MLFVVVPALDWAFQVHPQVDGLELRLDLFPKLDLEQLQQFAASAPLPLLFTLRKTTQGGQFKGSEQEIEKWIEKLFALQPAYFDLESDMDAAFLERMCKRSEKTRVMISYHNFQEVPKNLNAIYHEMSKFPAYSYKIAAHANSTSEALRLLLFGKEHPKLSVIAMGEFGEFARVLGKVCGNLFDFACLNQASKVAPGQLTAQEMIELYDYPRLNTATHLYGLMGQPVSQSQGHLFHNAYYRKVKRDSVYVKMDVSSTELPYFFSLIQELGFRGLSVTMPLKEKIIPFLNFVEPSANQIGAVNTILFKHDKLSGYNTDGVGALDAIEKRGAINGKMMVLLGAGGAARALAFEGRRRGAKILILNRSLHKAKELAAEVGGLAGNLNQLPATYDILVNCTPDSSVLDTQPIPSNAIVMDMVYVPRETPILQMALQNGCQVIYGEEMFHNQAMAQIQLGLGV